MATRYGSMRAGACRLRSALRRRPARFVGALCAAALWAACGSEGLSPDGPAWVEAGAGESEYDALEDGDLVPIVLGPQGGYMIALGLRAGGVVPGDPADPADPDNPRTTFRALDPDSGEVLGIVTQQRGLMELDEATFELLSSWLIFNPILDTGTYFDQEIELSVTLVDALGSEPLDTVSIVVAAP